jgi:hypothetical protein
MEEAIIFLKEQVVKEKNEARLQKNQLDQEKLETLGKARDQEALNEIKSKEVDVVKSNLKETDKTLRIIFRENEKLEKILNDLKTEIEKQEAQLNNDKTTYNNHVTEGIRLRNLDADTEKNYNETKNETIENTKNAGERTKIEIENVKELKEQQEMKKLEIKEIHNTLKSIQVQIEESKET